MKNKLKIVFTVLCLSVPFYAWVIDPILYDRAEVQPDPNYVNPYPNPYPDCRRSSSTITGTVVNQLCKGLEAVQANWRADPNNQYNTLEECLGDERGNTTLDMPREEWCDSDYVLISSFDKDKN